MKDTRKKRTPSTDAKDNTENYMFYDVLRSRVGLV